MATISSPGLGSGLDINGLVTKLMQVESQPLTDLNSKEANFQAKLSAFGALKGALSSLQSAAETLTGPSLYTSMSASVSDSTVMSAAADSTAADGSYEIAVSKLAKAQALHTNVDYGTDTFDSGTLRIALGNGTQVDVTLGSAKTLSGIRDAINGANAGVTASIVNDGTANRLVLASNTTGSDGAITITAPTSNNDGIRRLADLIGANLTEDRPAQNAELTVNGLAITRSSNTITDTIPGVTLSLTKADTVAPPTTKLTVAKSTASVQTAIGAFVKAYNDVVGQVKNLTAYDSANKKSSVLTGDSTARSVQSQLTAMMHATVSSVGGGISTLSSLGISVQKDGTLKTDTAKLADVLKDSNNDVAKLLSSTTAANTGIAVRFKDMLKGFVGTNGLIDSRTTGIAASIKDIGTQRDAMQLRLSAVEQRYRKQFTALDSLIASMNSTSSYLSQQLANLPGTSSR